MDQNMGFRFPRLGFDSLWVYINGDRYSDRHLCTTVSFFYFALRKRFLRSLGGPPGPLSPSVLPFNGGFSVFYEPIVGLAEVMVAKEAVVS